MIKIITGLPGAGKSLRGVQLTIAAIETGRPVYVCGLDGLIDLGQLPFDDPNDWASLPDGSMIVIDEAQKWWGQRGMGQPPPQIKALSEHRHRGFDFILITQHPTMLDKYVRTLCGEHQHVLRQFGAQMARIITWTECHDDPQSQATRARGTEVVWTYPKSLYEKYKSATLHTVKKRIPFRLLIIPVLLVVGLFLAYFGWKSITGIGGAGQPKKTTIGGLGQMGSSVASGAVAAQVPVTPASYIADRTPRIPHQPWSMPILDTRQVTAQPDLYCMSSETGTCTCMTEQGTRYQIPPRQCMTIARWGNYNPYRKPIQEAGPAQDRTARNEGQKAYMLDAQRNAVGVEGASGFPHGPGFGYKPPTAN